MISKGTIKAQKTVLWNLIIFSCTPIFMGVVPIMVEEVCFAFLQHSKLFIGGLPKNAVQGNRDGTRVLFNFASPFM
ncbi:hypothetical protein L596_020676 [Steinernema carpocapsae]|uniref:Uncharacterized protein n=1 Tax=Steinernema carpocapsae TaxID=34508 RepID=A0A4U5MU99_STECR|nr:hypothetical protein L596_020676 [Steinernema carpocapsae]